MIEFTGYFSGKAKKYYIYIERLLELIVMSFSFVAVFPFWFIAFGHILDFWLTLAIYIGMLLIILLVLIFIPFDKKFLPKRLYIEDGEYISVVLENGIEEYKCIADAKIVYDFGEFYAIKFYFGNKNNKFICQKDLITKGTLEEFEVLFEGKIERKFLR